MKEVTESSSYESFEACVAFFYKHDSRLGVSFVCCYISNVYFPCLDLLILIIVYYVIIKKKLLSIVFFP